MVARETVTKRAAAAGLPRADAPGDIGWRDDPGLAVQLEEVLATLTMKRRRFLLNYLDSGNATKSAFAAGYNCKDARSASDVGREILAAPAVQHAYQALMEASGLSTAKLTQVHALHLSRHSSPDGGDRDRSLRATALAYRYLRPPPAATGTKPLAEQLLDEMTPEELRSLAASGRWPVRFAARLGQAPAVGDPIGSGTGCAPEPSAEVPSAEPVLTPPTAPPPELPASAAPTAGSLPTTHPHGALSPTERTWQPSKPRDRRGADLLAELERTGEPLVPRDWYNRDRQW
jgi:hypothetical protein